MLAFALRLRPTTGVYGVLRYVSSGSVDVQAPLNFWGGVRRKIQSQLDNEPVYEPSTGRPYRSFIVAEFDCFSRPASKIWRQGRC